MSSRTELPLMPSRAAGTLAALPWLVLALVALALGLTQTAVLLVLLPLTLAGAAVAFRRQGLLLGRKAVHTLSLRQGQLWAEDGSQPPVAVTVSPESRISARLALLKLTPLTSRSGSKTLLLLDLGPHCRNVPREPFRHLRTWLRLG
ncbi:hypothetical protein [Marinobacter xestospongiae]|uniref:hypothetical protein n=1 Tax=Marinobacter xestospongiae TaxID=994319 RepID=UPI0020054AD6|nr:hypothetical protein [Marinobacter xestospongiae]MCK7567682.1 hypothetical protein [Marinobacter xestospongiae]